MNCCKHQGTTIVLDQFYTIILNEKRASLIRRVLGQHDKLTVAIRETVHHIIMHVELIL